MNGNVFSSEGIAPTLTTNKGEGNKIAIEARINSSQDGIVVSGGGQSYPHSRTRQCTESNVICIDKTVFGTERKIANTITAREDRGISAHNQEGTAVGIIVKHED